MAVMAYRLGPRDWGWVAEVAEAVEIGTAATWADAMDAAEAAEARALATAPRLF